MSFSVCAIMSTFNEEDIIEETVSNLIDQGVDVYILDNNSTDKTVDRISKFVGNGLVNIEKVVYYENGKEIYSWSAILERKSELSQTLDYDWFIHTDADEIRKSPWPGVNLKDGIKAVDDLGYNLINFKLFDFKLTKSTPKNGSTEQRLIFFSEHESFNSIQVKAWKKSPKVDLVSMAGHLAIIDRPKLFPIRFILKHYPVRSIEQGTKKILLERLARFSQEEKKHGWHIQYDQHARDAHKIAKELIHDQKYLEKFCQQRACLELTLECTKAFSLLRDITTANFNNLETEDFGLLPTTPFVTETVLSVFQKLTDDINTGKEADLTIPKQFMFTVSRLLKKKALSEFLSGNADFMEKLFKNSETVFLENPE